MASRYFNNPLHSDLQVIINGTSYYAHKVILGSVSNYYYTLFEGKFKEDCSLCIMEVESPQFLEIFKHIYGYKATITRENLEYLISEADAIGLNTLKEQCLASCLEYIDQLPIMKLVLEHQDEIEEKSIIFRKLCEFIEKDPSEMFRFMAENCHKTFLKCFISICFGENDYLNEHLNTIIKVFINDYSWSSPWERLELYTYVECFLDKDGQIEQLVKDAGNPTKEEARDYLSRYCWRNKSSRLDNCELLGYIRYIMTFRAIKALGLISNEKERDYQKDSDLFTYIIERIRLMKYLPKHII